MGKIMGWHLHGETSCNDVIAGALPPSGLHFLVCADDDTRKAIVADMSVAISAGPMASEVVQESKKSDGWRLASGLLGLATGEPCGVAIIGACGHADIDAAAAWRAIKSTLPVAVSTASKNDIVSARLHDLADGIRPTPLGLAIVMADWSRGVDEVRRILNYRGDFAVLVVSENEPPENLIARGARVLRVVDGSLTLAHPKTIAPWVAPFTLEAIKIGSAQAWGVRAGSEAASAPEFAPAAEEAPQAQEIRTIILGSDGVSTLDEVVAAVRDSDAPVRIVAPANEHEKIRAALDEAKETANRRLDLALGYRLRDARVGIAAVA